MLPVQSFFDDIAQETGSLLNDSTKKEWACSLAGASEDAAFLGSEDGSSGLPKSARADTSETGKKDSAKEAAFYSQLLKGCQKINIKSVLLDHLEEVNETELTAEVSQLIVGYLFYLGQDDKKIWRDKVKMKRKMVLENLYASLNEAKREGYDTRLAKRCFALVQELKDDAPFNHYFRESMLYTKLCLLEKRLRNYDIPVKSLNEVRLEKQLSSLQSKMEYMQFQMNQLLGAVRKLGASSIAHQVSPVPSADSSLLCASSKAPGER